MVKQLSSATRTRVLVIDDDHAVRRALVRILSTVIDEVVEAIDAQAALSAINDRCFDAIVSDVSMPGMDGLSLLRQVREHDRDVPMVLVTGQPDVASAAQAVELGAFNYLLKPVEPQALRDVVKRAIELHRIARMKEEAFKLVQGGVGSASELIALQVTFERALESLYVVFQPIGNHGMVYGHEAFVRTEEPGIPNPMAFIEAAERLRRMHDLSRAIRAAVVRAVEPAPVQSAGVLFVNLHPYDLLDEKLFSATSAFTHLAPRIVLEVTERQSLHEITDIRERVARLRKLGFRIAIDDLGAGYAGLTSFAQLEPEIVKLDMSLIRDVHHSPTKQRLIMSMTSLCRDMGRVVVAEGVEQVEERDVVVDLGCQLLQGYLFARPGRGFPTWSWGT